MTATMLSDQIKPAFEAAEAAAKAANAKLQDAKAAALKEGHDLTKQDSDVFASLSELAHAKQEADTAAAGLRDRLFTSLKIDGIQADPDLKPVDPKLQAGLLHAMQRGTFEAFAQDALDSEQYKAVADICKQSAGGWGGSRVLGSALDMSTFKALVTGASDTSGGAFIQEDRKGYIPLAQRALSIRNLVSVGTTDSDLVHYVRQTSWPTSAAITGEATTVAPGAEDGLSPEGDIAFTTETTPVKDVTETIPVHKNAFADAGTLQGIIENALKYDHLKNLEDEMLSGSGIGDHLDGLITEITQTFDANTAHENDIELIRKLITLIQISNEDDPNGVLINPVDAELQDLIRDDSGAGAGTGGYLSGSPWGAGPTTLYGLPRIVTNACPVGHAIVGNFKRSTLHLRQGVQVSASDSHKDWFARRVVALLCTGRYAFTVERPGSFAYGTFDR